MDNLGHVIASLGLGSSAKSAARENKAFADIEQALGEFQVVLAAIDRKASEALVPSKGKLETEAAVAEDPRTEALEALAGRNTALAATALDAAEAVEGQKIGLYPQVAAVPMELLDRPSVATSTGIEATADFIRIFTPADGSGATINLSALAPGDWRYRMVAVFVSAVQGGSGVLNSDGGNPPSDVEYGVFARHVAGGPSTDDALVYCTMPNGIVELKVDKDDGHLYAISTYTGGYADEVHFVLLGYHQENPPS